MLEVAKRICELQGIVYKPKTVVTVLCPRCEAKQFDLYSEGHGECRNCGAKKSVLEVERVAQEEWQDQHRKSINMMTKRGD